MLQKLRDQTQSTGFQILVIAIILVLVLFGFGATNMFSGADPELAQVGDVEITQNMLSYETERERIRILSRMGSDFDENSIDRLQLQEYTLGQLINRNVMYQTAADLGVRVGPDEVNRRLVASPAYQVDGRFNEDVYRQQLNMLGYSPVDFLQVYTDEASSEQVRNAVTESSLTTDWELNEIVRIVNQRRDLAFLPLTIEQFGQQVEVSAEEVQEYYETHQADYMTELAADVAYVELSATGLLDDESIAVDEEDLQKMYDDERAAALRDEQRDSSHILVAINDERDEAQALELITEAQARLAAGEAMADVAKDISEDPGSASQGGKLGPVGKGIFDPAFEAALWALAEIGDISTPVRSAFGYHLIQLDAIVEPAYPDFESQRATLTERVKRSQAEELFAQQAGELEEISYDERISLENSAAALGLEVVELQGISASNNADQALFSLPEILDAVFSEDVLQGNNSEIITIGNDRAVVLRVNAQYDPEPRPLDEVSAEVEQTLIAQRAAEAIELARGNALVRLEGGESVTEIANSLGSQWQSHTLVARVGANPTIPPQVLTYAFDLPRPAAGEKSVGSIDLDNGAALVTVTRVMQGDLATTPAAEIAELRRVVEGRTQRLELESFFSAAQARVGVTRVGALTAAIEE